MDANIRAGLMQEPMPLTLPHVPGLDVAGTVDAVGDEVTGLRVGDRVVGFLPFVVDGAAAEYTVAAADTLAAAGRGPPPRGRPPLALVRIRSKYFECESSG